VNSDGCAKGNPGEAGAGGLIRDARGQWLVAFTCDLGICTSVTAELEGIRQVDPMSPTLFVLAMEIFSCLMKEACVGTKFKYHWRCKNEEISHLCFADDLMMFSNGDLE
jgi:hypothetical protein